MTLLNSPIVPVDSLCPLIHANAPCKVLPLLYTLLDEVKALHQTLENQESEPKPVFKAPHHHLHVSALVIALQLEYPDKIWTSESFAKEIGCSGGAVRKTKAWKHYQERLEHEKSRRSHQMEHGNE